MKRTIFYIILILISFISSSFQYFYLGFSNYEKSIKEFLYYLGDDKIKIGSDEVKNSKFFYKTVDSEKIKNGKFCFGNYTMTDFNKTIDKLKEKCENKELDKFYCSELNIKNLLKLNSYIQSFSTELKLVSLFSSLKLNKDYCIDYEQGKYVEIDGKYYQYQDSRKIMLIGKNEKEIKNGYLKIKIEKEINSGNYFLIYK